MAKTREDEATGVQRLMTALADVTAADLAELDQQITAKREQIEQATAVLKKELDALTDCRKLLARRLGVETPRKQRKARQAKPEATADAAIMSMRKQRQVRIAKLLSVRGQTHGPVIQKELEIPQGSMSSVMDATYFESTAQGYRLTAAGRKELLGASP